MEQLTVNGATREVRSDPDTPLLYVLRNELAIDSPQFGCGLAQCGACSVLLDGSEIRACVTPLGAALGREVTTVEGLPARWAQREGKAGAVQHFEPHPVQAAWIEEQVPQCGFCQYGMMIKVTELLEQNPSPSDAQIKEALTTSGPSPHLCRCGSYQAILEGARRAAVLMAREVAG